MPNEISVKPGSNQISRHRTRKPKRQIRAAIVGQLRQVVRIIDLIKQPRAATDELRKQITAAHSCGDESIADCAVCGSPIYVAYALAPGRQGTAPYFKHYGDAGARCPWTTDQPEHPDVIRARQYEGKQKSPRHDLLTNAIATALGNDPSVVEVRIDKYHYPSHHEAGRGRFPDAYVRLNDQREFVFEMQLSRTSMTEISERREYYLKEGIWLMWLFDGQRNDYDNQFFQDIIQDHSHDAFLFDEDCIDASREAKRFLTKRLARRSGQFESREYVGFNDLKCLRGLLPFVEDGFSRETISDARQRRAFLVDARRKFGPLRHAAWRLNLAEVLDPEVLSDCDKEDKSPGDILSLAAIVLTAARSARVKLMSGEEFKKFNYDSKDNSLAAVINSWLSSEERKQYAGPLAQAIRELDLWDELPETSKTALSVRDLSEVVDGIEWRFLRWLFPEIFDEAVNAALRARGTFLA